MVRHELEMLLPQRVFTAIIDKLDKRHWFFSSQEEFDWFMIKQVHKLNPARPCSDENDVFIPSACPCCTSRKMRRLGRTLKNHGTRLSFRTQLATQVIVSNLFEQVLKELEESCFACHTILLKRFACGKCQSVVYCSRNCQVTHWKNHHRFICAKLVKRNKQRKAAAAAAAEMAEQKQQDKKKDPFDHDNHNECSQYDSDDDYNDHDDHDDDRQGKKPIERTNPEPKAESPVLSDAQWASIVAELD